MVILPYNLEKQPTANSLLWNYVSGIVEATSGSEHPLRVVGFPDANLELEYMLEQMIRNKPDQR